LNDVSASTFISCHNADAFRKIYKGLFSEIRQRKAIYSLTHVTRNQNGEVDEGGTHEHIAVKEGRVGSVFVDRIWGCQLDAAESLLYSSK
jgi:hypothetical protein